MDSVIEMNLVFFSLKIFSPFKRWLVDLANRENENTIICSTSPYSTIAINLFRAGLLSLAPETPSSANNSYSVI